MRSISSILALVLLGSSMTSVKIDAQWVLTNAPEGVYVYAFAVSGTNVFAGIDTDALVDSGGSVLRSTDNGANWTEARNGLTAPEVRALAISDTNIYAGTGGGGVYLSTNNAASWTEANTGLVDSFVAALAVSGSNIFAGTGGGVYLSTDNAATWTAVNTGLANLHVYSLAVSGTNIFAGTGGGLFLSTNNGATWSDISNGMPGFGWLGPIAVSDTNIFAGFGGGLFLSTNYGENWTDISNGLPDPWVLGLAVLDTNLFALTNWGGVSLSTDNGASWTLVNEGLIDTLVLAIGVSDTFAFVGGASGSMWRRPLSEMISPSVISVEDVAGSCPSSFNLAQNYPNPFNPVSTIRYDLPKAADVTLVVYDLIGREVTRLVDNHLQSGYHQVQWDGRDRRGLKIASGIYIARLVTPQYSKSIKMLLLK